MLLPLGLYVALEIALAGAAPACPCPDSLLPRLSAHLSADVLTACSGVHLKPLTPLVQPHKQADTSFMHLFTTWKYFAFESSVLAAAALTSAQRCPAGGV